MQKRNHFENIKLERTVIVRFIIASLPFNVRLICLRRMKWVGHVACVGEKFIQKFDHRSEGKRLNRRPRRRCEYGRLLTGFIWLMIANSMGLCKRCNESSDSITVEGCLD